MRKIKKAKEQDKRKFDKKILEIIEYEDGSVEVFKDGVEIHNILSLEYEKRSRTSHAALTVTTKTYMKYIGDEDKDTKNKGEINK